LRLYVIRRSWKSRGPLTAIPNGKVAIMVFRHRLYILLVDDEEDIVIVTASVLERLGHTVRVETQSLNALRRFSEEPDRFDLAILDHVMPDLTGLELAQRFRRIRPGFPVLLYAGYREKPSSQNIEAAGIGRFILKPKTSEELGGMISKALAG
jgi:two-component system, cell cycle sensor histidine kinase and response regulator CckA